MSKRRRPWSSSGQLGNTSADSFPSTAQECFSKILEDEQFCDITFLLGPSKEQVKAHQSFLMARSAMLRANLSDEWGAKDSIIELPQFDPPAFKSFLKFVYTDQVDLEDTDWMSVLKVAHYFLVKPLQSYCAEIGLKDACSGVTKALETFHTARLYDQQDMMDEIGEFMAKSFIELSKTEKFQEEMDDETLCYLLGLDHLRVNEGELFKIVLNLSTARANSTGNDRTSVVVTNTMTEVATEMGKFLPLIRFPTMDSEDFQTKVDASGFFPTDAVVSFYRFFTAKNPVTKLAIAGTWPHGYSHVHRRCREFVKFYNNSSSSLPEMRRQISGDAVHLEDYVSFTPNMTNLLEVDEEAKHVPPCGGKGVAITGIEIQCPALFYGGKVYECRLDCHIDIKEGDPHYMEDLRPKFQTTYTIRPNEVVEVPMHHTIPLPASGSITGIKGVRITAEINIVFLAKDRKEGQELVLVQSPELFKTGKVKAEFCGKKFKFSSLTKRQTAGGNVNDWQLIRGIRMQAL